MASDWRDDAACLGAAPLWDATIDDGGPDSETAKQRQERHHLAIMVCEHCPVCRECGADAVIGRDEGVRGGILFPSQSAQHRREWREKAS
ncbi:MAG: WhiB family transcriptional regulator [Mycobacteriaceae bacterium]